MKSVVFVLSLALASSMQIRIAQAEPEAEAGGIPVMDAGQRQAMGIVTEKVGQRSLSREISAPGEVTINRYRTSQVTTRISAQIIERHARMGDEVRRGQRLLTLSSVAMAEAQSRLLVTDREWQRVRKLGNAVVSDRRYIAAQVDRQHAYARVLAYGMTPAQVGRLLEQGDASRATGTFDLPSPQDGTVISDPFVLGQVVEPGQLLMEISDETRVWVEARINPVDVVDIAIGAPAWIDPGDGKPLAGKVVQIHRRVDETTRTLPVRIEVDNRAARLRPGQFVKVALQTAMADARIAVLRAALTLLHGDQVVFVLEGDRIEPRLVETGRMRDDWVAIRNGLQPGEAIVVQGVFLLKSLLLKSQIGDSD